MSHASLRSVALAFAGGAVALSLAACSGAASGPAWSFTPASVGVAKAPVAAPASRGVPAAAPTSAPAAEPVAYAADPVTAHLALTIVTGDMTGKNEYPAYIPSDFTLPANATVVVTITNFDDATALTGGATVYAKASGIAGGTFTVTPIAPGDPNGAAGRTTAASSLDPTKVSHTFTIPALGINVPIAAHARVTFTIHTGAPGTYAWRCFDPCGDGPLGWGTAMAARRGYMSGTLTVA